MEIIQKELNGIILIKPAIFEDDRGYFFESFSTEKLRKLGINIDFVQDNESKSQKDVLRGLHFQNPPYEQGKLIRVIKGSVLDVVIDIRKNSPSYGKWHKFELNEINKHLLWVPPGFAHGFLTLEDNTIFTYKCTNFYNKESEWSILWNDESLNIDWKIENPLLSDKDKLASKFTSFETQFEY